MLNVILCITLAISFLNLLILVVIGAFLVQFRERVNGLFKDFINVIENLFSSSSSDVKNEVHIPRTWDEKYEHELLLQSRRMSSGLQDLPDPTVSWGQPPQATVQPDLKIQNKI